MCLVYASAIQCVTMTIYFMPKMQQMHNISRIFVEISVWIVDDGQFRWLPCQWTFIMRERKKRRRIDAITGQCRIYSNKIWIYSAERVFMCAMEQQCHNAAPTRIHMKIIKCLITIKDWKFISIWNLKTNPFITLTEKFCRVFWFA